MFEFLRKRTAPKCPLKDDRRQWLEDAFPRLVDTFGKDAVLQRRVLKPHHSDFPIRYNGEDDTARQTLDIVARQMEIDPNEIDLTIYKEGVNEISTGNPLGTALFLGNFEDEKYSSGLSFGSGEDGKYHLSLEGRKLRQPENMVATLAHELAHIKLLGEGRLTENDEQSTELTTIIFGLGIFNANASFTTFRDFRSQDWQKQGYLTQMDWGYALALFARLRQETEPAWAEHLCKNVRSDLLKSQLYLSAR